MHSELQELILQSHLYGKEQDIFHKLYPELVQSSDGGLIIARSLRKNDPLAVVIDVFQKFWLFWYKAWRA